MTRAEFVSIVAYIGAAVGKPLAKDAIAVYFDLLGDLPRHVLQLAAKRVVLEHKWASFPTVAELRAAAVETMHASVGAMSAGEAWDVATRACWDCDVEIRGDVERALGSLPPLVRLAVQRFGFRAVYNPGNLETMRAQFRTIFEEVVAEQKRDALLPPTLRQQIEQVPIRDGELPAPVRDRLRSIGQMPV